MFELGGKTKHLMIMTAPTGNSEYLPMTLSVPLGFILGNIFGYKLNVLSKSSSSRKKIMAEPKLFLHNTILSFKIV